MPICIYIYIKDHVKKYTLLQHKNILLADYHNFIVKQLLIFANDKMLNRVGFH